MTYTCNTCGKKLNGYRSTGMCKVCLAKAVDDRQAEFNRLYNSGMSAQKAVLHMGMFKTAAQSYMERGVKSGAIVKRGAKSLGRSENYGSLIRGFAALDAADADMIRMNIRPGETLADALFRMVLS